MCVFSRNKTPKPLVSFDAIHVIALVKLAPIKCINFVTDITVSVMIKKVTYLQRYVSFIDLYLKSSLPRIYLADDSKNKTSVCMNLKLNLEALNDQDIISGFNDKVLNLWHLILYVVVSGIHFLSVRTLSTETFKCQ